MISTRRGAPAALDVGAHLVERPPDRREREVDPSPAQPEERSPVRVRPRGSRSRTTPPPPRTHRSAGSRRAGSRPIRGVPGGWAGERLAGAPPRRPPRPRLPEAGRSRTGGRGSCRGTAPGPAARRTSAWSAAVHPLARRRSNTRWQSAIIWQYAMPASNGETSSAVTATITSSRSAIPSAVCPANEGHPQAGAARASCRPRPRAPPRSRRPPRSRAAPPPPRPGTGWAGR